MLTCGAQVPGEGGCTVPRPDECDIFQHGHGRVDGTRGSLQNGSCVRGRNRHVLLVRWVDFPDYGVFFVCWLVVVVVVM